MKTQTKIAALFFLISVVIIVLLSGSVYYFVFRYTFNDFYKRLEIRAVVAAKAYLYEDGPVADFQAVREEHLERLPEEKDYFFEISELTNFAKVADSLGLPMDFFNAILAHENATHQKGSLFFSGIRYESDKGNYAVIVSAENYYYSHHLANLRGIFLLAIVAASVLSLYLSILFSRRIFVPVKEITDKFNIISSENLHMRLEPSTVSDEINELKMSLNNMLDRLETSFETQNNFISNASHELSTPLTSIIGETDVALAKSRSPEEYIESLNIISREAERLDKITKSLLLLAQTGFDGKRQKFERLRADQLLWDVKDTVAKINNKWKVQIDLGRMPESPEGLKVMGNQQLLLLALINIVNNACKYSGNLPVTLSISTDNERVTIEVTDSGIGIPESDLPHIYDPFFRASNTRDYEGYGIGLPLTRNIVRMHRGDMTVSSQENKGTTVKLNFPVAPHPAN